MKPWELAFIARIFIVERMVYQCTIVCCLFFGIYSYMEHLGKHLYTIVNFEYIWYPYVEDFLPLSQVWLTLLFFYFNQIFFQNLWNTNKAENRNWEWFYIFEYTCDYSRWLLILVSYTLWCASWMPNMPLRPEYKTGQFA